MTDVSKAVFKKSTHSGSGSCVEVAEGDATIFVRDSKDQAGPVLMFNPEEWRAFVAGVRDGEFD
jgi:hypothetical protein